MSIKVDENIEGEKIMSGSFKTLFTGNDTQTISIWTAKTGKDDTKKCSFELLRVMEDRRRLSVHTGSQKIERLLRAERMVAML